MKLLKPHVEVIFWRRLVFLVVFKCELTVAHRIHMESVTFCLVSGALLINMSPLKSCCLFINVQPPTKNPCSSRHFLNMFEKWVDLKVQVCSSQWRFEQRILHRKTTFPLLVTDGCGRPKHTVDKRATLDWVLVGSYELHFYTW